LEAVEGVVDVGASAAFGVGEAGAVGGGVVSIGGGVVLPIKRFLGTSKTR
jgi:hypothetical protein